MSETLQVGDTFPVKSSQELREQGIRYSAQIILTVLGTFRYDSEDEWRDGQSRWISEDGQIQVTTLNINNEITSIIRK